MSKHIAVLSIAAALLGVAALPGAAFAADLYGYGYGGEDRPLALHSREDVYLDGGRAHVVRRDDIRPEGYGDRRAPGPVVYDERGREGEGYGSGFGPHLGWGGEGRPVAFAPPPPPPAYGYGEGWRGGPAFRPAAAFREAPAFGEPEGGCTVERARTITPAGWEKTVTHRTCYRR